jgi:flavodoxin
MGRDLLCAWQARTAGETLNSQEAKAVFPMNQLKDALPVEAKQALLSTKTKRANPLELCDGRKLLPAGRGH